MSINVNPFDGKVIKHPDEVNKGIGAPIPELLEDPSPPVKEYAWIRRVNDVPTGGKPIGLLLALTYAGLFRHYFSYYTLTGIIKRVEITRINL